MKKTPFRAMDGRLVERREIIGHEGGEPPILVEYRDYITDEVLGVYAKSASGDGMTGGKMFAK